MVVVAVAAGSESAGAGVGPVGGRSDGRCWLAPPLRRASPTPPPARPPASQPARPPANFGVPTRPNPAQSFSRQPDHHPGGYGWSGGNTDSWMRKGRAGKKYRTRDIVDADARVRGKVDSLSESEASGM